MFIKVGTLVLCHLLTPNKSQTEQEKKVEQISGIVKEISEEKQIEMVGDDYAVEKKKFMLLVEPENKNKIFRINVDACKPVISEAEHLLITKKKISDKKKKDFQNSDKTLTPVESLDKKNQEQPSPQLQNKEKENLLKELEN